MQSLSISYDTGIEPAELLQHVGVAVIASDLNFMVTNFNHAAEKMYGFSATQVLGREFHSLIQYDFGNTSQSEARMMTKSW